MRNLLRFSQAIVATGAIVLPLSIQAQDNTFSKFKGASFEYLLESAMLANPVVSGQEARIGAEQYNIDSAKAQRLPSLSFNTFDGDDSDLTASLSLNQPIYTFGRIASDISLAESNKVLSHLQLNQVKRNLIDQIIASYSSILTLKDRIVAAKDNVVAHQTLLSRVERRSVGRLATDADVQLALSRTTGAKASVIELEGQLRVALFGLESLVAQPVNDVSSLPESFNFSALDKSVERALAVNEVLAINKQHIAVARERENVERKRLMPTLSGTAEYAYVDDQSDRDELSVALRFRSELDGMGFVAQRSSKRARQLVYAAEAEVKQSQLEVTRQVEQLNVDIISNKQLIAAKKIVVDSVESTLKSFVRQYESGRKSWVEVLNTQRELNTERQQLEVLKGRAMQLKLSLGNRVGQFDSLANIVWQDGAF